MEKKMQLAKTVLFLILACLIFGNDTNGKSVSRVKNTINANEFESKRLIVQFLPGTPLDLRKIFFVKLGLDPIAFDIFGYDIAESNKKTKKDFYSGAGLQQVISGSGGVKSALLDYQVEKKEKQHRKEAGCTQKPPMTVFDSKLISQWYEKKLGISKAHDYLRKGGAIFWPQGVVIADDHPSFTHPDIAPALRKDRDTGKIIFWARQRNDNIVESHGTHVACLAAGYKDGKGVEGVGGPNAYILPLVLGYGNTNDIFASDIAIGLQYYKDLESAGKIVFRVVNMSFTFGTDLHVVRAAIKQQPQKLFMVAAGNQARNLDTTKQKKYPAAWRLPNLITVGALNKDDELVNFSNYGPKTVSISAPGVAVTSCVPGGYESWAGTSMASPIVAGAAVLLFSANPMFTADYVKNTLFKSADKNEKLKGKIQKERSLNVWNAVKMAAERVEMVH